MLKPSFKQRPQVYEFSECVKYIEGVLGYKLRDTLGRFEPEYNASVEYRDWWHFLVNFKEIHNGCEITIGEDLLEEGLEWQNEITQAFIDEFGSDAWYWVQW